ncbi:unnamed protein product [Didymodactylos carnosus]|uniref:Glutathione S-transferase n=1 Tax=Didymodactylos carnosus TaxID=1234261 RepID=A0A814IA54_9BILA|nr:unnamed protein product [Didymodactylos carnosus]CAF3792208.1 unnamed protein product [Didymodactylos carnosus]
MAANQSEKINIRLHYWNCRGRVQTIRYMLADIVEKYPNVEYSETFELIEAKGAWPAKKKDANITGPFGNLPILHWNSKHIIAQTFPIGQFLAKKFSLYGKSTDNDTDQELHMAQIDGVVSCAYTDVILNMLQSIWSNADFEDKNNSEYRLGIKITDSIKTLDKLLQQSSTSYFYNQQEPTIADYFVFESYTLVRDVAIKLYPSNECQALNKHEQAMKSQPGLNKYFRKNLLFETITASPTEDEWKQKQGNKNKQ